MQTKTSRIQREAILAFLAAGKKLTQLEAKSRFGCLRLAARIEELRKAGHPIPSRMVAVPGHEHKVAEYWLERRASAPPPPRQASLNL